MTREEIIRIVKRFPYIDKAIASNCSKVKFYIGNRKNEIVITESVKQIKEFVMLIYETEDDMWLKLMIKGIITEKHDVQIMREIHYTKSVYYPRKEAFLQKVYECCISKGIVTFEEVLKVKIV